MPGPNVDIGNDLVVFVDPQAANSFGTPAADYPVAADAVRVLAGVQTSGATNFSMYEDKRGTATKQGVICEKKEASLQLEMYAYTTTAGTAPDWGDLLLSGGWQATTGTGTTVSGSGSTTTVVDVVDASGLAVGGCVEISGELRRITATDTVSTPDNITVTPALTAAPADTTTVTAGITYYPKDARADAQDALTAWAGNNRSLERFVGFVPATFNLTMGGAGAARWSINGPARSRSALWSTTLSGGIDAAVTTVAVTNGTACPADASATNPYYFQFGDVSGEVIKVIAVSGNNWTVGTRGVYAHGGAAASHSNGDEVFPAIPTGTYAGTPVPACSGDIIINADDAMQLDSVSLDCDMGIVPREDEAFDAQKLAGYVLGMRSIRVTGAGSSYYDHSGVRMQETFNRTAVQFFAQQNATSGSIIAIECPTVRLESSDIDRGADEVQFTLTGEAEGTTEKEDEVYIMVA